MTPCVHQGPVVVNVHARGMSCLYVVPYTPRLAAQLQSAASSPAAGGMWSRDSSGWGAAFAPGANEAALRTQAAMALGVDGLPPGRHGLEM